MEQNQEQKGRFQIEKLEERIAPSNANFPPGQFPSGNPAHAPAGNLAYVSAPSTPYEFTTTNPSNDK